MFGDYSSYSVELDLLSENIEEDEDSDDEEVTYKLKEEGL